MPTTPRATPIDGEKLEDITGFCLSGGGYRAMLFHVGALWRLNELSYLASPYLKSSKTVTLSALVHRPILPASMNVASSTAKSALPS